LAFRSAEKTLNETRSKIQELLHIPRVIESGNAALCHAAKELEEAVAFYMRKTIEKHDVSKNYKVQVLGIMCVLWGSNQCRFLGF